MTRIEVLTAENGRSDGFLLHRAGLTSRTQHFTPSTYLFYHSHQRPINYMKIITAVTSSGPLDEPCLSFSNTRTLALREKRWKF